MLNIIISSDKTYDTLEAQHFIILAYYVIIDPQVSGERYEVICILYPVSPHLLRKQHVVGGPLL
jgi:hypothetical protein